MDGLRIYTRSLSATQANQLYIDSKNGQSASSTIVSQEINPGDRWSCNVTPNNGFADGQTKTADYLTVTIVGNGTVAKNPNQTSFDIGDKVQLTAIPAVGWSFSRWSGAISSLVNPIDVTINKTTSVTATFTQIEYSLSASAVGNGSVVKSPNQASYHYGDIVQLTAIPAVGWSFSRWSGDLSGSISPANLTITGNMTVVATFTQIGYSLMFSTVGNGSVIRNPDQASYHYGDSVQLTASPSIGWSFSGWTGDLSGSTNPSTISVTKNMTVTATFSRNAYPVSVSKLGNGDVSLSPGPYYYGDIANLTATPATGWSFSRWNGTFSSSGNPVSIIINGTTSVTANFIHNGYNFTISTVGSGSVSKNPDQASFNIGDIVSLTATPATGWSFGGWSGSFISSANPESIIINGTASVTATFIQNTYTVSVNINPSSGGIVSGYTSGQLYHYGDVVSLIANPNNGYTFTGWSGDGTGSTTRTVTITGNMNIEADFTQTSNPTSTPTPPPTKTTPNPSPQATSTPTPQPTATSTISPTTSPPNGSTSATLIPIYIGASVGLIIIASVMALYILRKK